MVSPTVKGENARASNNNSLWVLDYLLDVLYKLSMLSKE